MAKIKYDVTDVESNEMDFDTPIPTGLYRAKVDEITEGTSQSSGNPMLTVVIRITKGDWKDRLLWDYIVLNDASAWKMKQLVKALGLKEKGSFDPQAQVGTALMVRVKHETDEEYGTRSKVGALLPIPDDEMEEEEEGEEEQDGDDDELTYADLEEYDRDDLEELIEEEGLEVKFNSKTKDDVLMERVAEAMGLEPEEDEDEDEDDEDYSEWSVADLKAAAKERGLKSSGSKKLLIKRLEEDDEEDDDGDEPF